MPLFFAQALGISFYLAGFSESVVSLFPAVSMPVVGIASLAVLTVVAYLSADLALKAQLLIFILIVASLVSFFMGGALDLPTAGAGPVPPVKSFWVVFAVFFPAVTGIEAGLAMSGDLKKPSRSLPWGTLASVGVSLVVYLAIPIFLFRTIQDPAMLRTNFFIMKDVAISGELIVAGLWGATLSSALGALLGSARTLQALARDRVTLPFLGKGYGPAKEPRIATAVSAGVALIGILMGDLNVIAPVLSMFFLRAPLKTSLQCHPCESRDP